MSGSTFRYWAGHMWLRPMCRFEVEYDKIGEVCSVFVLAAKYEEFITLIKGCSMTYVC